MNRKCFDDWKKLISKHPVVEMHDSRDPIHVLADAARRDPSVRIKICLDGRKDLVEITKTVKTSTTRNNFWPRESDRQCRHLEIMVVVETHAYSLTRTPTPAFEGHGREPRRILTDLWQTGAAEQWNENQFGAKWETPSDFLRTIYFLHYFLRTIYSGPLKPGTCLKPSSNNSFPRNELFDFPKINLRNTEQKIFW